MQRAILGCWFPGSEAPWTPSFNVLFHQLQCALPRRAAGTELLWSGDVLAGDRSLVTFQVLCSCSISGRMLLALRYALSSWT